MSARERRAAYLSWANTTDVDARTKPGRDAAEARFEAQFAHITDPAERTRRAAAARKAHYIALGEASGRARRAKRKT